MKVIHKIHAINRYFFPSLQEDETLAASDYLIYIQFVIYLLIASIAIF